MDHHKWSLRWGTALICCALVWRLGTQGAFQPLVRFLARPEVASFLLYCETGRIVRFSASEEDVPAFAGESPAPDRVSEAALPVFSLADGQAVSIRNNCGKSFDPEALVTMPLTWDLTGEEPTVLILHTHTTESYTRSPGEVYTESSDYRTLDAEYNMLSVGAHLAGLLEDGGLTVLQDRQLHDYPSYNGSYADARKSIQWYLEEYPSIRLVLDLHRDAAGTVDNQMVTQAAVKGEDSAQLMFVVGTDGSGLNHPDWQENLALAMKLQVLLEREAPGVCRPIDLRAQRFNQDESPGALLVEVGAAGNTRAQALTAVEALAEAILALARGSQ